MRRLKRHVSEARESESGATLIFVAMILVVLMGMAGFAVDFGWLYWNGVKIQHGADAAALAGVIYEPGDQTTAYSEAEGAASENGYLKSNPGTTVAPVDFAEDSTAVENSNQLAVTVTHEVPTFFMKVFGIDSVTISKRAVAEYALPLAMGSDLPYFGTDPSNPARNPGFWANIHGYFVSRTMGDRFAAQCNSGAGSSCPKNPERRETVTATNGDITGGYLYGIDVPDGASGLAVEIFDGRFFTGGGDPILAGDELKSSDASDAPVTRFLLYGPDPTPLDTTDGNTLLCTVVYDPQVSFADFSGDGSVDSGDDQDGDGDIDWDDVEFAYVGGVAALWDRMCSTTFSAGGGIYVLRVVIDADDDSRGLNRYSLRVSTGAGGEPRIYGLQDMAIYANIPTGQANFKLAEVPQVHAGKVLVIELWDADSGNEGVKITMPDGSAPECSAVETDGTVTVISDCDISFDTDLNRVDFASDHLQIRIDIPNDYTCTANCWWTIDVDYDSPPNNDTTTWSARIEGNPVRLVE